MSRLWVSLGNLSTDLFLLFLILKLTHVISWSWWLVTSPMWGCSCMAIITVIFCLLIEAFKGER